MCEQNEIEIRSHAFRKERKKWEVKKWGEKFLDYFTLTKFFSDNCIFHFFVFPVQAGSNPYQRPNICNTNTIELNTVSIFVSVT